MTGAEAPDGFHPLRAPSGRRGGFDPIRYHARRVEGRLALGFRVGPEHLNPGGRCHGGLLATFCDVMLAFTILHDSVDVKATFAPTVNLTLDYLAGAPEGAWVEGMASTLSVTRNLAVAQCVVTADSAPIVRCSGTFKVGGGRASGVDVGDWLRAQLGRDGAA